MIKNNTIKKNIFIYYLIPCLLIYILLFVLSVITIIRFNNRAYTISVILILIALTLLIIYSLIKINDLLNPLNDLNRYLDNLNKFKYYKTRNYYNTSTYNILFEELYNLSKAIENLKEKYEAQTKIIDEYQNNKTFVELEEKDLIYSISHELKTPLAIIEAEAYAVLDKIYEGDEADKALEKIISECKESVSLVQDVLNVFKLNRADFKENLEEFDLLDLINEKVNQFSDLIEKHKHTLILNTTSSIIKSNRKQLSLALSNILNNAITNSPLGSTIIINLVNLNNEFQIDITNSNAFIPEEKLATIFNPFVKVDISHKRKDYTGNGLGLYIVKQILTKLDYDYGILNTNQGVKFFIVGKK